jgi:hypothetical protein
MFLLVINNYFLIYKYEKKHEKILKKCFKI